MTQGLDDTLEVILFDEGELNTLKQAVQQLYDHTISPQQIRTLIFNSHVRMLNDLKFFLTQYYKGNEKTPQFNNNNKNKDNQDSDPSKSNALSSEVINELREKNELLELVGGRLQKIYAKMKEKQDLSSPPSYSANHSVLNKIRETYQEAEKTFNEGVYKEYIRFSYMILEIWINYFYSLIPPIQDKEVRKVTLSDKIDVIEITLKISFQFKKGFKYWGSVRGGIAHENDSADSEQAEKARKYFEYAEKECAYYYILYG